MPGKMGQEWGAVSQPLGAVNLLSNIPQEGLLRKGPIDGLERA
jgi:hypothetical protein